MSSFVTLHIFNFFEFRTILTLWELWERSGSVGEPPGGFGEMERGTNFEFFSKFGENFNFDVFGHFQIPDVKEMRQIECPCGQGIWPE